MMAPVLETEITDSLTVAGRYGETLEVWAGPGRVVLDLIDGDESVSAHLTIEQAEQHVAHMRQMIAAAGIRR